MTSSTKTHTSTKINLKIDSKKHKNLFLDIKNSNSIDSDVETFKFLVENFEKTKLEIKILNTQMLNLRLIMINS